MQIPLCFCVILVMIKSSDIFVCYYGHGLSTWFIWASNPIYLNTGIICYSIPGCICFLFSSYKTKKNFLKK